MIFTECPYCNESRCFNYDPKWGGHWVSNLCRDCGKVMWFNNTCAPGGQTITHEMMLEKFPKLTEEINRIKEVAQDICCIEKELSK